MSRKIIDYLLPITLLLLGYFIGHNNKQSANLEISDHLLFEQLERLDYKDIKSVLFNRDSTSLILIDQQGNARTIPTKLLVSGLSKNSMVSKQYTAKLKKQNPLSNSNIDDPKLILDFPLTASATSKSMTKTSVKSSAAALNLPKEDVNQRVLSELPIYLFSKVPTDMSLIYTSAAQPAKDTLVVFTDPSCPHCREFHAKYLPRLLKDGYNVRYMPVARVTGINPDGSYRYNSQVEKRLQWALCLDDRFAQIDKLFKNKAQNDPTEPSQCDETRWNIENIIKLSFHFVKAARGTPAIFSQNGYASNKKLPDGLQLAPGVPAFSERNYQKFINQLALFEVKK